MTEADRDPATGPPSDAPRRPSNHAADGWKKTDDEIGPPSDSGWVGSVQPMADPYRRTPANEPPFESLDTSREWATIDETDNLPRYRRGRATGPPSESPPRVCGYRWNGPRPEVPDSSVIHVCAERDEHKLPHRCGCGAGVAVVGDVEVRLP